MLRLGPSPGKVRVLNTDMLLELLKSVVGAGGERVKSGRVKVAGRDMTVRQQGRRGDVVG